MKTRSQYMAHSAVATALAVILLYLASVVPSGRLAVVCASSICVVFVRMRCGKMWSLLCFGASALLALLLLPEKGVALLYSVFLGYYPLIKLDTERMSNRMLRWTVRIGVFNMAFLVLSLLARAFMSSWLADARGSWLLLWILANGVFVVYDYAVKQIVLIYLRKIDGRI